MPSVCCERQTGGISMSESNTSRNRSKNLEKYKVKIKCLKLWKKSLIKKVEKYRMYTVFEMKKAPGRQSRSNFFRI